MTANIEFGEIQRKNLEAAMRLAQISIENSQRIMSLQSQLARDLFQDSVDQAKATTGATAAEDLVQLRTHYTQETMQKLITTAQQVAEIGNNTRVEFSRLLTEQLAAGSQEMADAFQSFFKALPGQNSNVLETMQKAMATANAAFEQISRASSAAFEGTGKAGPRTKK
jgi:phasin family protein